MSLVSTCFLAMAFLFFAWKRLMTYLQMLQQDDYDCDRFWDWIKQHKAFDRKASICLLALVVPASVLPQFADIFKMVGALCMATIGWMEADPRVSGKKKLALTARASRIIWAAFGLCCITIPLAVYLQSGLLVWVFYIQLIPYLLMAATWMLDPWEQSVQKTFLDEAHKKLLDLKPFTIGITGSFGKTSTKHILGHVLSQFAPTLVTPGSINTPMGITRVVRETLAPHHKYFICEMGAYGESSIKRLCDLAPPDAAVLVTVGHAHYERFKSLETVAKTKCELPEAATAKGGWSVIGSDVLDFEHTNTFINANRGRVTLVGHRDGDDIRVTDVGQDADGIYAKIIWNGVNHTLTAPLFGLHHATNMVLAFATACRMGLDPVLVTAAFKTTPQIRHRLEVIHQPSGAIVIDDAYNSNPQGFKSALEVLSLLGKGRRRILISPGMIEMGEAHDAEHRKLGAQAAVDCDVFLPVSPVRIKAMTDAFKANAPHKLVVPCATFADAQKWLGDNMRHDDIVLLENDLPDLYERKINL
ncbi:MAG: UDP-N-acetylmuramoyl-tripeptide--D-alanyl-D-alanine ligase [Alphaproteobacteria bacterium]|nr:UDP-N-acetylmuramoyl-tripeptide--D-alanyl-D-alanine ligase [Alphaproteobacteria bacterium]